MITVTPATLRDLTEAAPLERRSWKALVVQIARSFAVALRDGDRLVALAGVYPHPDDCAEIWVHWLVGRNSSRAPLVVRRLLGLAKDLRRVTIIVKDDCKAGLRMAGLARFQELDHPFEGYTRFIKGG